MLTFNPKPGGHERKLQRRLGNPLFSEEQRKVKESELMEAQHRDFEEVQAFLQEFQTLVEEAAGLEGNAESEQILNLKERIDEAYERCSGLGGDMDQIKMALQKLVEVIMVSVRNAAGDDPVALEKLEMEDEARLMHYSLLEYPFIADMLRQDDLLSPEELVPGLLSESEQAVAGAAQLFEPEQLEQICLDAAKLLNGLSEQGLDAPDAWKSYAQLMKMRELQLSELSSGSGAAGS
jgi:hypothetical protein